MIRVVCVVVVLVFCSFGHGQTITLRNHANTISVTVPARGELRCTYYQPIQLMDRGSSRWSWGATADPAVTGADAYNYAPRFRWEYLAGQSLNTITAMAFGQYPGGVTGAANPTSSGTARAVYWGSPGSGNFRWWASAGPNVYPFCINHGVHSYTSGDRWPIEYAGNTTATAANLPADRSTFEVWVDPAAYMDAGSMGYFAKGLYPDPFLWMRFEAFDLDVGSAEGGMPPECCEDLLAALGDIEDELFATRGILTDWYADWTAQAAALTSWITRWDSQDVFLRDNLAEILASLSGTPSSDGPPAVVEPEPIRSVQDLAEEVDGGGIVAPPVLGIGSDRTEPPVWTFVLPSNPLASLGGPANVNRSYTVNFGSVPEWETVILVVHAGFFVWAGLWAVGMLWEEFRKY